MERTITNIIEDLHRLDPAFDVNDPKLREMVTELISKRPLTHFDEAFAARLRSELVGTKPVYEEQYIVTPYLSYFSFLHTKVFTGVAGALLAIILVAPLTYVFTKKTVEEQTPGIAVKNISSGLTLKQQINTKDNNAFGKLAYITLPSPASSDASIAAKSMPLSLGMTSATTLGTQASSTAENPVVSTEVSAVVYTGTELNLTETEGKVYKRVKGADAGKQLAGFLQNANFNVVNMEAFSDLSLETIQLSEDVAYGHTLGINFNEGTISINPNSEKWASTSESHVPDPVPTKISNDERIQIAHTYMSDHGIDISGYGKPVIEGNNVVFPLLIDGLEVYEENGSVYGLQIIFDEKENKVAAIYNLNSQLYESSLYSLETTASKVIKAATNIVEAHSHEATINKELQTPHRILIRYWDGDPAHELYVPALLFITKEKGKFDTTIVVPLVKDALDKISLSEHAPKL